MSLLRLLTTGKSLVGVQSTEVRYRLTRQRLLPNFGPGKNPFLSRRDAAPVQAEVALQTSNTGNSAPAANGSMPEMARFPVPVFGRNPQGGPVFAGPGNGGSAKGLWRRFAGFLAGWGKKAETLVERPKASEAKPCLPRLTKTPVQGELSLDTIKVVRNDLTDADLEVVASCRPAPAASREPVQLMEARGERIDASLNPSTTSLLGSGKA